jgi:hypothetical protein
LYVVSFDIWDTVCEENLGLSVECGKAVAGAVILADVCAKKMEETRGGERSIQ